MKTISTLKKTSMIVFSRVSSWVIFFILFGLFIVFSGWVMNLQLFFSLIASSNVSLLGKSVLLLDSFKTLFVRFGSLEAVVIVVTAVLFSLNGTFLAYYVKKKIALDRAVGLGVLGTVAGVIGLGCGACGSLLLTSLLGTGAAAGVISVLPFDGLEFAFAGIFLLACSLFFTVRKVSQPLVCKK